MAIRRSFEANFFYERGMGDKAMPVKKNIKKGAIIIEGDIEGKVTVMNTTHVIVEYGEGKHEIVLPLKFLKYTQGARE